MLVGMLVICILTRPRLLQSKIVPMAACRLQDTANDFIWALLASRSAGSIVF
jgi:hypothetical protein